MANLPFLAPEIFLSLAAVGLLLAESFIKGSRRFWINAGVLAVAGTGYLVIRLLTVQAGVSGMIVVDGLSQYFKLVLLSGVLLVLWMSADYRGFSNDMSWGSYTALLLLSCTGLLLLVSASDFLMAVIAFELISITSFILTGFMRRERKSSEAAIKFFLVGTLSSGLMIYGISLLYGVFGNTGFESLRSAPANASAALPMVGGILFVLVGIGFKMGMVPFHMWIPDAFEGAPTPITAYLSVAPKAAILGLLVRALPHHESLHLTGIFAVLAAATMTVGNLSALKQRSVKRMLAYSSVAQIGYILVGFVAAGRLGLASVLIYTLAYVFMNLGAFACVIAVSNHTQTDDLEGFSGLAKKSFPLALVTTVFMLSLTGLPPMLGFVGKFSIFSAAISGGWIWLAVIGVLNSVVSLYYYFKIVRQMFFAFKDADGTQPISLSPALLGSVSLTLFITLAAGLFPNCILTWVNQVVP